MEYESVIYTIFFGILIFILYLFVFGILHGARGIINWSVIALVLVIILKAVKSV